MGEAHDFSFGHKQLGGSINGGVGYMCLKLRKKLMLWVWILRFICILLPFQTVGDEGLHNMSVG